MTAPRSEFSRPFPVAALPATGQAFSVAAEERERSALAGRFGIIAIDRLEGEGALTPHGGAGDVRLSARLNAQVRQRCVVTLEVFTATIANSFEAIFSPRVRDEWTDVNAHEIVAEDSDEAFFEPLIGGVVDVGEALAQQLALELPSHPRKPGAVLDPEVGGAGFESDASSSFALLAQRGAGRTRTP